MCRQPSRERGAPTWRVVVPLVLMLALNCAWRAKAALTVCQKPDQWKVIGNREFCLVVEAMPQPVAQARCRSLGGDLASIHDARTNGEVHKMVIEQFHIKSMDEVEYGTGAAAWLGLVLHRNSQPTWTDGSKNDYNKTWSANGEDPNLFRTNPTATQACVHLGYLTYDSDPKKVYLEEGSWGDDDCSKLWWPMCARRKTGDHGKRSRVKVGLIVGGVGAAVLAVAAAVLLLCLYGKPIFRRWRALRRPPNARRLELLTKAVRPRLQRQVFISHTGQDEAAKTFAASILKPMLEKAGLRVFMDFTDLPPGCHWPEELVLAAANSAVFVAVLSRHYYQRYWCMLELDLALNAHNLAANGGSQIPRTTTQRMAAAICGNAPTVPLIGRGGSSKPAGPRIIPVFYDPPEEVIPSTKGRKGGAAVCQFWDSSKAKLQRKDKELHSELSRWVDAKEWAANLLRVKADYQGVRRTRNGAKDVDRRAAEEATEAAVQLMRGLPADTTAPSDTLPDV